MIRLISRAIIALVTAVLMISGNCYNDKTADYLNHLDSIDTYENTRNTAIAAKNVHDIIENHFSSGLPEGKTSKKAIFIGYDGVRADAFSYLDTHETSAINDVLSDGGKAYISYAGGANYPYMILQATDSGPGWTTMLTGELAYKHKVWYNEYQKSDSTPTLMMSLIDDGLADSTAAYSTWAEYLTVILPSEIADAENRGLNAKYQAADPDGELATDYEKDELLAEKVKAEVSGDDCADFVFALFESTDEAGHSTGYSINNDEYLDAFVHEDSLAEGIISAIKARPTYDTEDWLIIFSTDHGGFNQGHGYCTAQERYTYIVANKDLTDYKNNFGC